MNFETLKRRIADYLSEREAIHYRLYWSGVYGALIIVILAVFVPLKLQADGSSERLKELRNTVQAMSQIKLQGSDDMRLIGAMQKDLDKEGHQFVSSAEISDVIQEISRHAEEIGATIKKVGHDNVEAKDKESTYTQLRITMEIEGDYANVSQLIGVLKDRIAAFFTWETIHMHSLDDAKGIVVAKLEMGFYSQEK